MNYILIPQDFIVIPNDENNCFTPEYRCAVCRQTQIGPMRDREINGEKGVSCWDDDCVRILEHQVTGAKAYKHKLMEVVKEIKKENSYREGLGSRLTATWDQV